MDNVLAEEVLTIKQATAMLGGGLTTTYELFEAGEIRGYRLGRRKGIRVYASSVRELMERRANAPARVAAEPVQMSKPDPVARPKAGPLRPRRGKSRSFEDVVLIRSA